MFDNVASLNEVLNLKNIIIYVIVINVIAFLAMFIDKKKAQKGKWRISEKALFVLVLLGGGIGSLICYACIELYINKLIRSRDHGL